MSGFSTRTSLVSLRPSSSFSPAPRWREAAREFVQTSREGSDLGEYSGGELSVHADLFRFLPPLSLRLLLRGTYLYSPVLQAARDS